MIQELVNSLIQTFQNLLVDPFVALLPAFIVIKWWGITLLALVGASFIIRLLPWSWAQQAAGFLAIAILVFTIGLTRGVYVAKQTPPKKAPPPKQQPPGWQWDKKE